VSFFLVWRQGSDTGVRSWEGKHPEKSATGCLAEKKVQGTLGNACKGKFPKAVTYIYYSKFCNILNLAALIFETLACVVDRI